MEEYKEVMRRITQVILETIKGPEEDVEAITDKIVTEVMDAIADNYRSISQVHSIIESIRAGQRVQIAYTDPDEGDFNPYVMRACW